MLASTLAPCAKAKSATEATPAFRLFAGPRTLNVRPDKVGSSFVSIKMSEDLSHW